MHKKGQIFIHLRCFLPFLRKIHFLSLFLLPSSPCLHHWQPPITPIIHFTLLSRQSSPSPSFSSFERQHHRHHQIFLQWFLSLMCSCGCCGYSCCQRHCCLLLHHQHDEAAIADHRLSFSSSSRRCCLFSSATELLQVTMSSSLFSFDCLNWSSRSSSSSAPSLLTAAPSSLPFVLSIFDQHHWHIFFFLLFVTINRAQVRHQQKPSLLFNDQLASSPTWFVVAAAWLNRSGCGEVRSLLLPRSVMVAAMGGNRWSFPSSSPARQQVQVGVMLLLDLVSCLMLVSVELLITG